MSSTNNSTNQNSVQIPHANIEHAQKQHWDELSQVALYLFYLLANRMKALPALTAGSLWDEYLGQCLLSHLRAEFTDIAWPESWSQLEAEDIPKAMVDKLHFVARRRTFRGACEICAGWIQDDDPPESAVIETQEAIGQFLEAKRGKVGKKSWESYRHTLNPFAKEFEILPQTPEPIDAYLARPQFKKTKSSAGAHTVLSMLYAFAEQRLGVKNVLKLVGKPRVKQSDPHAFSLEELRLVLAACNDDRGLALVHLSSGHGLRTEEMCSLLVGDVADDRVYIGGGKERNEAMPLLPETLPILRRLANGRRPDEPLFVSQMKRQLSDRMAYNVVKGVLVRAGVLENKPTEWRMATHTLRKTFSSLMLAAGCDSRMVQRLLRHRGRDTTDLYLAITFQQLRQTLERYSPLRQLDYQTPDQKFPKILSCSIRNPPLAIWLVGKSASFT